MPFDISHWYFIKALTQSSESIGRNLGSFQLLSKRPTPELLMQGNCPAKALLQEKNPQMYELNGKWECIIKCMIQVLLCELCLFDKILLELLTIAPDIGKCKIMKLAKEWFYSLKKVPVLYKTLPLLWHSLQYKYTNTWFPTIISPTGECSLRYGDQLSIFYFYLIFCLDQTFGKHWWR